MLAKFLSVVQCHCRGDPNEREAQSAMRLCFPATCSGVRGQHCLIFMRNARARSNRAPTFDCRDAIRSTQLTEGELSLKRATFLFSNDGCTASITNHIIISPAISRSAMDSRPEGLVIDIRSPRISSGHLPRKTVGGMCDCSPIMTPPNPCPDASVYPTMCGQPPTSWRHRVGAATDSRRRVRMSTSAVLRSLFRCRKTTLGLRERMPLHGDNKPRPAGMAVKA